MSEGERNGWRGPGGLAALRERVQARRDEIEEEIAGRMCSTAEPIEAEWGVDANELRQAVSAGLDYALFTVEDGEGRPGPPPAVLVAQARLAARSGIDLNVLLRRYLVAYGFLRDFVIEECAAIDLLDHGQLQELLQARTRLLDRLLATVSDEFMREAPSRRGPSDRRRAECVDRLLAGEPVDTTQLPYDLGGFHLGLVATGPTADQAIRALGGKLDRRLLLVRRTEGTVWAWLGGRRPLDPRELADLFDRSRQPGVSLAVGEPAPGIGGWRLSHEQARAALPVAQRRPGSATRYADVPLLAAIVEDETLLSSLDRLYLRPLDAGRDGGQTLRETLRAYLGADRRVTPAAAALGVSCETVVGRLRTIEERLGRSIGSCASGIEVALQVDALFAGRGMPSASSRG